MKGWPDRQNVIIDRGLLVGKTLLPTETAGGTIVVIKEVTVEALRVIIETTGTMIVEALRVVIETTGTITVGALRVIIETTGTMTVEALRVIIETTGTMTMNTVTTTMTTIIAVVMAAADITGILFRIYRGSRVCVCVCARARACVRVTKRKWAICPCIPFFHLQSNNCRETLNLL